MSKIQNWIWQEKYRATKIEDLLLPKRIRETFSEYVAQNEVPHLLLEGTAGIGKTTASKALINELNAKDLYINASSENGIDVIRSKVTDFISARSINNAKKIVVLDECDALTINAQQSLKVIMEEYSKHSRFFLLTNNINKIIEPIRSRCTEIKFNFETADDIKEIQELYFARCAQILKMEDVSIALESVKKLLAKIVSDCFPDLRKTIGILQSLVTENKGDLSKVKFVTYGEKIDTVIDLMKSKDINSIRKYMADNFKNYEIDSVYKLFYKKIGNVISEKLLLCQALIIISKYLYQNSIVQDKEINMMGMIAELITEVFANA